MLISAAWLNRYLDPGTLSPEEIERALMEAGFPIESRETLPGGDARLDVEITSNRGDCLSLVGLAREVAAKTGRTFKPPVWTDPAPGPAPIRDLLRLENRDHSVCPLFTARLIRSVKVGPSPSWLVKALESIGQRTISNVVDVTNFITFEFGNPCHVFDLAKLKGNSLVIRWAKEGESLATLDGKKRALKGDELVVADAERATSLAGVIGGADSEVSASTTDVVLEMATWAPVTVRRAARRLGIRTDASHRFERTVDARTIDEAARRAAALIVEVSGGQLCPGVLSEGKALPEPLTVRLRPSRCRLLVGIPIATDEMVRHLRAVGAIVEPVGRGGDELRCTIPPWRPDLLREADLIEEVARLKGLDAIPIAERLSVAVAPIQPRDKAVREIGALLSGMGFYETVTFSFVNAEQALPFTVPGIATLIVDDERRGAEGVLRPSVIPSLLACRRKNQDGRVAVPGGVRLFEIASIFGEEIDRPGAEPRDGSLRPPGRGRTVERRHVALLADAAPQGVKAGMAEKQSCIRVLRGVIETLASLAGSGADLVIEPMTPPMSALDKSACAGVSLNGQPLGYFGLIDGGFQAQSGLDVPVAVAELNLDTLIAGYPPKAKMTGLPAFPGIERDLSVIVPETVRWSDIAALVDSARLRWNERVEFIGAYRGKQIGPGRKSLTLRLHFRDAHRTLRGEEVDPQVAGLVDTLKAHLGAELRTAPA